LSLLAASTSRRKVDFPAWDLAAQREALIPGRLRGSGDMRMLLQWGKDVNCNYVHLADEMGLMVWAEVPVY
jgi:hypothetical protein